MNERVTHSIPDDLLTLERFVLRARRAAVREHRLQKAVHGATWAGIAAIMAVVIWRLLGWPLQYSWWLLMSIPVVSLVRLATTTTGGIDAYRVAKQIDRQLGLQDRLAGGYDLLLRIRADGGVPLGPFTELLVADAAAALDEARRSYRFHMRVPAGAWKPCVLTLLAASLPYLIFPGPPPVEQANRITETQRREIASANEAILNMAKSIASAQGASDESKQKSLELIKSLTMNQEQLNKMTKADLIRKLKEIDSKSKLLEGSQDAAVQHAIADNMQALKDMEQINKNLAELESLNMRKAELALGDGHKVAVAKIDLKASDLNLQQAVDRAMAISKQPESEILKRAEDDERRRSAQREKLKNYVPKNSSSDAGKTGDQKFSQMVADNKELQNQLLSAIQDSTGEKLKGMNNVIRPNLEREIQNDNIPLGMRNQLRTYSDQIGK